LRRLNLILFQLLEKSGNKNKKERLIDLLEIPTMEAASPVSSQHPTFLSRFITKYGKKAWSLGTTTSCLSHLREKTFTFEKKKKNNFSLLTLKEHYPFPLLIIITIRSLWSLTP
jgi:hypothetical protein